MIYDFLLCVLELVSCCHAVMLAGYRQASLVEEEEEARERRGDVGVGGKWLFEFFKETGMVWTLATKIAWSYDLYINFNLSAKLVASLISTRRTIVGLCNNSKITIRE